MPISDDDEDPVRRTQRQLRCYYECVSRDEGPFFELTEKGRRELEDAGELCPDCGGCDDHCRCDEDDDLGLPRY